MSIARLNIFPQRVLLNERTSTVLGSEKFRYGYQGSEQDNEVKGEGNSYTTEFRQLDPRLGRWLTIDPEAKKYPWESPYASMNNNPIFYNDVDGDDPQKRMKRKIERFEKKLTKAGITNRAQRDYLIGMKWNESKLSKKIETEITGYNGDSKSTGSNFTYDYSKLLPNLAIRTLFKGGLADPIDPNAVPGEISKVVDLVINLQLNIDIIGVVNQKAGGTKQEKQRGRNLALGRAIYIRDAFLAAGVPANQINSVSGARPGTRLETPDVDTESEAYKNRKIVIELPNTRTVVRRLKKANN